MARLRRKRKGRTGYTDSHRLQLRVQWDYLGDGFGDGPESIPAMRTAWEDIGAEVLVEHIAERPGTRPWAWWQWDAPEPRNKLEAELKQLERLSVLTADERQILKEGTQ